VSERDPAAARRLRVLLTLGVAAALIVAALAFRLGPSLNLNASVRPPAEPRSAEAPVVAGRVGPRADPAASDAVRTLYLGSCAGCHGRDLAGGVGPALDGSLGSPAPGRERIREVVRQGHGRMPPIGSAWSDEELDAVATFVRERWRVGAGAERAEDP
jgi:mono/diheme cytochrome c family protein